MICDICEDEDCGTPIPPIREDWEHVPQPHIRGSLSYCFGCTAYCYCAGAMTQCAYCVEHEAETVDVKER